MTSTALLLPTFPPVSIPVPGWMKLSDTIFYSGIGCYIVFLLARWARGIFASADDEDAHAEDEPENLGDLYPRVDLIRDREAGPTTLPGPSASADDLVSPNDPDFLALRKDWIGLSFVNAKANMPSKYVLVISKLNGRVVVCPIFSTSAQTKIFVEVRGPVENPRSWWIEKMRLE